MNKNIIIAAVVTVLIVCGFFVWKYVSMPVVVEEQIPMQVEKTIQTDTTTKIDENFNSIDVNLNVDEDFKSIDADLNSI